MRTRLTVPFSVCLAAALLCSGRAHAQASLDFDDGRPQPTATVQVDWLLMHRNRPISQSLIRTQPGGVDILNGDDFDFGMDSGIQVKALYQLDADWSAEFRYFGIYDTNSALRFRLPVGGFGEQTNPPSGTFNADAGSFGEYFYRSDLNSFDLNLRRALDPSFTLVAGMRYINLNEHLGGLYNYAGAAPGQEKLDWNTNNNLYGFQIGVDTKLWTSAGGRLQLDGFVRAGIYANDASSTFNFRFAGGADSGGVDSQLHTSFVADAGLNLTYNVTQSISLRTGYQFLWLSGVALASEQVNTTGFIQAGGIPTNINFGDAFYNGLNVGVEFRW